MADADIKIKISKDAAEFDKGLKESQAAGEKLASILEEKIGSSGSRAVGVLSEAMSSRFLLAAGAAAVAVGALHKALDFTIHAEQIEQINNSFKDLATSAGFNAEALKSSLADAAQGLAGTDDILQAANRGIIQLGDGAIRMEETLRNARKATALFRGDFLQNFSTMNDALATGNVRALRQFGIIVDSDDAQKKFAKSLGVTSDVLTEQGKRAAIVAAALDAMNKKFANIDETTAKATNALQRMKVSFSDLTDEFAKAVRSSGAAEVAFGHLKEQADFYAGLIRDNFGTATEQAAAKLKKAQADVQYYRDAIADLNKQMGSASGIDRGLLAADVGALSTKLLQAEMALKSLQAQTKQSVGFGDLKNADRQSDLRDPSRGNNLIDLNAVRARQAQAQTALQQMRGSLLAANEAYYSQNSDLVQRAADLDAIAEQKRLQIADDYDSRIQQLKAQNAQNNLMTRAQMNEAEILLESEKQARIAAIQNQSTIEYQAKSKQLADSFRATLAGGISSGIQSTVTALMKGQNAFEAFGKALLNMFGDLAIMTGEFFISQGVAAMAMKFLDPSGTIAAGAGLVALGTILKSFGGGESSSGGTVGSSVASSAGTTNSIDTQNTKPTTAVTVNIQGNVLDRRQTGLYIADTLNEYFGASDGRLVAAS